MNQVTLRIEALNRGQGRTTLASATGDTMRRALSNLADRPGVRDLEPRADYEIAVDFEEVETE